MLESGGCKLNIRSLEGKHWMPEIAKIGAPTSGPYPKELGSLRIADYMEFKRYVSMESKLKNIADQILKGTANLNQDVIRAMSWLLDNPIGLLIVLAVLWGLLYLGIFSV